MNLPVPAVMGILNVTPDSFSDGGRFVKPDIALRQAAAMAADGAAILDIGGESTRPGASAASMASRSWIGSCRSSRQSATVTDVPISVDTSKPAVMRAAVAAGAAMINDVHALQGEGALEAAADLQVPVCLMHMQGEPRDHAGEPRTTTMWSPKWPRFLSRAWRRASRQGSRQELHRSWIRALVSARRTAHNVELLANLRQLRVRGLARAGWHVSRNRRSVS